MALSVPTRSQAASKLPASDCDASAFAGRTFTENASPPNSMKYFRREYAYSHSENVSKNTRLSPFPRPKIADSAAGLAERAIFGKNVLSPVGLERSIGRRAYSADSDFSAA